MNIFSQFGTPRAIISESGSHFCNHMFKALLDIYGMGHKVAIPYHPQMSGIVASGIIPDPGSLKAKSTTMVDVPTKVPHSALLSLVRDIAADWDIDYTLELGFIIDLPVFGNFTIPLTYSGEYKLPTFSDLWRGDEAEEEKEEKTEKVKKEEKEEKEKKERKE
ncbi:Desiccation-related protein PCC27-45 [Capsicum chinense]|nr:Desiccation-related protein PCC27-45 [Capsicum chinense]